MMVVFHKFDESILELSYQWLQDEELRLLINAPLTNREAQRLWFDQLPSRDDYIINAVFADGVPVGVAGFKHINNHTAAYFGYIGVKEWRGKGIGKQMMEMAFAVARERKWQSISLQVIAANYPAINLYFSKGFKIASFENGIFNMIKNLPS